MRRLLKLQHHRHTGKLLPHRYTSYRALFFILAIFGLIIFIVQQRVIADDLFVTGKVPAPIPTQPAIITLPSNGATLPPGDSTVSGTCEVLNPPIIIAVYSGDTLLGSTTCQSDGRFSLIVHFAIGTYTLVAKSVNITNDYGPDSAPVTIFVAVVKKPGSSSAPGQMGGSSSSSGQPGAGALRVDSENPFVVFGRTKKAVWRVLIRAGAPPYTVVIDWGDGTIDHLKGISAGDFTHSHTYKSLRTFALVITVTDSAGSTIIQHIVAVTPDSQVAGGTTKPIRLPPLFTFNQIIIIVYSSYAALVGTVALAWYDAEIRRLRLIPHRVRTGTPYSKKTRNKR